MEKIEQVQSDWNQLDDEQIDYIKNKPTVFSEWFGTQEEYDDIEIKDQDKIYNIKYEAQIIGDNEIRYTSTDNQQINNFTTTGLTILSHTFTNGVGSIVLDPSTVDLPSLFANNTRLDTIEFGKNILLNNEKVLASNNETTVLSSITLPANLTTVGARLLRNRRGISTLDIPATVTSIGTFMVWTNDWNREFLQSITCRPTIPPTIEKFTFVVGEPSSAIQGNFVPIVYVPATSVTAYQTATVWSEYVAAGMQILPIQ